MAIERVMLFNNIFQLHASIVQKNGKGILFTAPSGTGKSTQAELWEKYENAMIINGDKAMIRKTDETFLACGSPYAGTSKIYKDISVPICSIIVLSQAAENKLERLPKAEAFRKIYKEAAVNAWNAEFLTRLTDLIHELISVVPVYHLACRPDIGAVEILKNELFP